MAFFFREKKLFSQSNRSALKRPVRDDSALVGTQALEQGGVWESVLVDGNPRIVVLLLAERAAASKAVEIRALGGFCFSDDRGGGAGILLGNGKHAVVLSTSGAADGRSGWGNNLLMSWGDTELGC